jgi:hypothetical protein
VVKVQILIGGLIIEVGSFVNYMPLTLLKKDSSGHLRQVVICTDFTSVRIFLLLKLSEAVRRYISLSVNANEMYFTPVACYIAVWRWNENLAF